MRIGVLAQRTGVSRRLLLHCVHEEGERLVPSGCPGMIGNLRRERGRIAESITRLEASQRALDAMLTAALHRQGSDDAERGHATRSN